MGQDDYTEDSDEYEDDFGDEYDDEDEDTEDESDDESEAGLFDVTEEPRTVCQLCGGAGVIADPKLAVIGGVPRTIDNGRQCPHCDGARTFTGMIAPL
jgi:hypothetical protein